MIKPGTYITLLGLKRSGTVNNVVVVVIFDVAPEKAKKINTESNPRSARIS